MVVTSVSLFCHHRPREQKGEHVTGTEDVQSSTARQMRQTFISDKPYHLYATHPWQLRPAPPSFRTSATPAFSPEHPWLCDCFRPSSLQKVTELFFALRHVDQHLRYKKPRIEEHRGQLKQTQEEASEHPCTPDAAVPQRDRRMNIGCSDQNLFACQ